jgi:hypothetical protein
MSNFLDIYLLLVYWSFASLYTTGILSFLIFKSKGVNPWISFIPFYNCYVLCKILDIKFPHIMDYIFLNIFVTPILMLIITLKLPYYFKKDSLYTLGLIFLPFIFFPIIAFKRRS